MDVCDVCCEKFNKIKHKKVECPYCDLKSCRSCSQKYILSSHQDPHCMGCKTAWNREFVDSFCTKYFRNTELRRHRENVLFEREKALMPETQPEVERIINMRKLKLILQSQRERLLELHYRNTGENEITPEIRDLYRDMENTYRYLQELRSSQRDTIPEPRTFVRKCPKEECKGFLSEEWFCGLCNVYYCKECNEQLTEGHECDPEMVKTMQLLNKDSKSCPNCGTVIHKTDGCSQMWCINCHTAFNFTTGQIETGRIHNPHFIEFRRKNIGSREHGDIPCGGSPSFRELREHNATNTILQYSLIIYQFERELIFMDDRPANNLNFRIAYMLNEVTEEYFKTFLQRQEKFKEKVKDVSYVYEMVANTGGDLLRQYIIHPDRHDEIVGILCKLMEYTNDVFADIRKRYNSAVPRKINL
jgi:hypothetical protein